MSDRIRILLYSWNQRWSPRGRPWPRGRPRGHILKSLALASRPQVLENWPALGSRTALFFESLKFCGALEKFFRKRFFVEIAWKIFVKTFFFFFFFFGEHLRLCPWSLALASSIPVLGLESVCPRKGCSWPWPRIFFVSLALALASSLVSSTPPLVEILYLYLSILYLSINWILYSWNVYLSPVYSVRLVIFFYNILREMLCGH